MLCNAEVMFRHLCLQGRRQRRRHSPPPPVLPAAAERLSALLRQRDPAEASAIPPGAHARLTNYNRRLHTVWTFPSRPAPLLSTGPTRARPPAPAAAQELAPGPADLVAYARTAWEDLLLFLVGSLGPPEPMNGSTCAAG